MPDAPPQHHYRTRRASAIGLLKENQQASTDSSASDSSWHDSSSPVSTASTASTSREIHQQESSTSDSCGTPSRSAKVSLDSTQRQSEMATMTDGHPRPYPHHHLPPLLQHGQQYSHSLPHHQHPRHSDILAQHGGARSEYGDIPGSPAPVIHRPASAAAHLSYTADAGRSSPHILERSNSSTNSTNNESAINRKITSAPSGAATPPAGAMQDTPRTPASPVHMSAASTEGVEASRKRGRSGDIKEQGHERSLPPIAPISSGPDLRSRRADARRPQGQQDAITYTTTNTTTPRSDIGGPRSASSTGTTDIVTGGAHAGPSTTTGAGSNVPGGNPGGRELICLCTRAPKVPRPRNAFILYRQHHQASVAANNPGLANPEISKLIGEQWRDQPDEVKDSWKRLAEEEKIRHQQQYPDYRYQPRRGGKAGANHGNGARPMSAGGDDPGRCNKCGGRYIATPRTPSTPYTPTTGEMTTPGAAPGSAGPGSGGSGYGGSAYYTPNSRGLESEHLRRGSISSISSGDSHARRYNTHSQYSLANIDEDYAAHQQHQITPPDSMSSPGSKRRRYNNNSSTYPISPPVTGSYAPSDPRYQSYQQGWPSTSHPAGGALTYGSGQNPRGEPAHIPPQDGHPMPTPTRTHPLSMSHTPGAPQVDHHQTQQQQQQHGATQLGPAFDESLRLPPLQSTLSQSSATSAEGHALQNRGPMDRQYQQGHPMDHRSADPGAGDLSRHTLPAPIPQQQPPPHQRSWPQAQAQEPYHGHNQAYRHDQREHQDYYQQQTAAKSASDSSRWPFLMKLEALRAIQPPLSTQQSRSFETRGPVIAVEGTDFSALREVARVIETALLVSQDCAVKVWSDESLSRVNDEDQANDPDDRSRAQEQMPRRAQPSLANYMSKMLRWHRTSEELVDYITHHPAKQQAGQGASSMAVDPSKMPVAIVSTGYSLTVSDKWAAALQDPGVTDAYSADDHWRWIATLWRGIVGADLTIYVREQHDGLGEGPLGSGSVDSSHSGVELLTASAISASNNGRATPSGSGGARSSSRGEDACVMVVTMEQGRGMDEKLERRLGFEIMEWVRGGGFSAAATLRQLSSSALAGLA